MHLAWVALGVALLVGNGAGALGLPAVVLAAALTLRGGLPDKWWPWILATGIVGLARPPGLYADQRVVIEVLQLAILFFVLRRNLALAVVLHVLAGALLLQASPHPAIDVFHLQQEGSADLLRGWNPYSAHFTNPYGEADRIAFLGNSSPFLESYPYPPLSLLVTTLSFVLTHDVRWAMLLAQAAIALLLLRLARRSPHAPLVAGLSLLHPRGLFVVEQAWTEPLLGAAFLLVMVLLQEKKTRAAALALGAFLALKQYSIVLVPLFAARVRRGWWIAIAFAAAVTLPFVVWDARALADDLVGFQLRQPFRMDALSLLPAVAWLTGWRPPSWISFVAAGAALAWVWRKLPSGLAGIPLGGALVSFAFLLFAKQAFCNYYYFVGILLLASIAASLPEGEPVAVEEPPLWLNAAAVAGIAVVACLPFLRYVAWLGDEGVMLHAAQRIARGEQLYRDFFAILPPLPFWWTALWHRLFPGLFAARILATGIIAATAVATFLACVRAGGSRLVAACLSLGVVWAVQGEWTVLGHRWMTALFCMSGAALVLGKTARPFAGGLFFGAAFMTTPPTGALAAAAALFAVGRPQIGRLVAGSAVVPALGALALLLQGTLGDALRSVFGFMFDGYTAIQALPFGHGVTSQSLLIVLLFPAAALAAIKVRPGAPLAFAVAGALACLPRADVPHLAFAAPLLCPLLAVALQDPPRWLRAAGLVVAFATLFGWHQQARDSQLRAPFPVAVGGTVRFGFGADPAELEPMLRRIATLPPHESVSFYPYDPMLAYLTARQHLGPIDLFSPGYTRLDQYRASCAALTGGSDWLLFDRYLASRERIRQSFPATRDRRPPETAGFEHALESAFVPLVSSGRFELRRRIAGAHTCPF